MAQLVRWKKFVLLCCVLLLITHRYVRAMVAPLVLQACEIIAPYIPQISNLITVGYIATTYKAPTPEEILSPPTLKSSEPIPIIQTSLVFPKTTDYHVPEIPTVPSEISVSIPSNHPLQNIIRNEVNSVLELQSVPMQSVRYDASTAVIAEKPQRHIAPKLSGVQTPLRKKLALKALQLYQETVEFSLRLATDHSYKNHITKRLNNFLQLLFLSNSEKASYDERLLARYYLTQFSLPGPLQHYAQTVIANLIPLYFHSDGSLCPHAQLTQNASNIIANFVYTIVDKKCWKQTVKKGDLYNSNQALKWPGSWSAWWNYSQEPCSSEMLSRINNNSYNKRIIKHIEAKYTVVAIPPLPPLPPTPAELQISEPEFVPITTQPQEPLVTPIPQPLPSIPPTPRIQPRPEDFILFNSITGENTPAKTPPAPATEPEVKIPSREEMLKILGITEEQLQQAKERIKKLFPDLEFELEHILLPDHKLNGAPKGWHYDYLEKLKNSGLLDIIQDDGKAGGLSKIYWRFPGQSLKEKPLTILIDVPFEDFIEIAIEVINEALKKTGDREPSVIVNNIKFDVKFANSDQKRISSLYPKKD